ncbi:hypothetical protein BUALT_Bualt04G0047400 [Buddleja alternifolia]|uniref:J domain-containing protein n=1 Tax=Buddleja alternifolia TaxID=168488 RepID=A0AAV6XT52_9LAMI|nr:hypothetical protein BUALT_Bualt04G0047400 [Buddleja alternifolia]
MMGTNQPAPEGSALAACGPPYPANDNRSRNGRPWCDHCKKPNHAKNTCWKIHGKPANWKPSRQQPDRESRGNATSIEETLASPSPSPFNKEQLEIDIVISSKRSLIFNVGRILWLPGKHRRESLFEDSDENSFERVFHSTFGKQGFTWNSDTGFDWRENSRWSNSRFDEQNYKSTTGSDVESCIIGAYADRKILGLPTAGPLKIEDVKAAFRSSALKWHPDKHQGSSQADAAEEKFKHCVNAYKSLCNAFSTA